LEWRLRSAWSLAFSGYRGALRCEILAKLCPE